MEISDHEALKHLIEFYDAKADKAIGLDLVDQAEEAKEEAERIASTLAKFDEGDEVRWYESPIHPHNRGVVLEVHRTGWPEWNPLDGRDWGFAYTVEFPGPEGVGTETFPVHEHSLLPYEDEA